MPGLYGTAYALRFALKRRGVEDKVGPLEGQAGGRLASGPDRVHASERRSQA
jgi:hypothetical protein